jgi:hypothetical protein
MGSVIRRRAGIIEEQSDSGMVAPSARSTGTLVGYSIPTAAGPYGLPEQAATKVGPFACRLTRPLQ